MARHKAPLPPTSPVRAGGPAPGQNGGKRIRTPGMVTPVRTPRVEARIAKVRAMLGRAIPVRTIAAQLAVEWGLKERMIREYIAMAYRDAAADAGLGELASIRAQLREAMEETYQLAVGTGDLKAATMLLDRLAKLSGAYAPTQVQVNGGVETVIGVGNPEGTRERIRELLASPEVQAALAEGGGENQGKG